jgi:mannosyl-3-phosphoglycerate phosphatase
MDFPLLIFTDLDGTLLDHHSYSFKGAEEALQILRQHSIPLILNSSKTKAELQVLQEKLGLNEPFIAENGGGIYLPADFAGLDTNTLESLDGYWGMQFGKSYTYLRRIFAKLRDKYKIKGFGDMTAEDIMKITGLSLEEAILARKRNFTEPFQFFSESRPQELQNEVFDYGLRVTRGGRFYHLMSAEQDKGRAVEKTVHLFQAQNLEKLITVGLGDAENDYSMLEVVDIPVLIPKPDGCYEKMDLPGLLRAPSPGSRGWGSVVKAILNEFAK